MFINRKDIVKEIVVPGFFKNKISREKSFQSNIESSINRLHYKVTALFLLSFAVVITYLEYFEKISCIGDPKSKTAVQTINTYCFIQSTFTLPKHFKINIGTAEALFGVGTHNTITDEIKYHAYYQWVPIVLVLQSMMFYLPRLILKNWDGDKIKKITGKYFKLSLKIPLIFV